MFLFAVVVRTKPAIFVLLLLLLLLLYSHCCPEPETLQE